MGKRLDFLYGRSGSQWFYHPIHADHSMMWSAAMLCVSDCADDCVWFGLPQPTEWAAYRKSDWRRPAPGAL